MSSSDIFSEINEKNEQFLRDLDNSPSIKIRGVVGATGIGGFSSSDQWQMVFSLLYWESDNSEPAATEVRVEMPLSHRDELSEYRKLFSPYDVVEIEGKIGNHPRGNQQVLMTGFVGIVTDNERLTWHAKELQKPVHINDPILGQLTLDRTINVFECKNSWLNREITFSLSAEEGSIEPLLPKAHRIFKSPKEWDNRTKEYAARELLELKNDTWLDDDETEITRDEFVQKLQLTTISFESDNTCSFWFDDGDLFWGHCICVTLDSNNNPIDAEMMG